MRSGRLTPGLQVVGFDVLVVDPPAPVTGVEFRGHVTVVGRVHFRDCAFPAPNHGGTVSPAPQTAS